MNTHADNLYPNNSIYLTTPNGWMFLNDNSSTLNNYSSQVIRTVYASTLSSGNQQVDIISCNDNYIPSTSAYLGDYDDQVFKTTSSYETYHNSSTLVNSVTCPNLSPNEYALVHVAINSIQTYSVPIFVLVLTNQTNLRKVLTKLHISSILLDSHQ